MKLLVLKMASLDRKFLEYHVDWFGMLAPCQQLQQLV